MNKELQKSLIDAAEASEVLRCTRNRISRMVARSPIEKDNLRIQIDLLADKIKTVLELLP